MWQAEPSLLQDLGDTSAPSKLHGLKTQNIVLFTYIVTYSGLAYLIIMGSGFDDWIYWHFFAITVDCNSSHIEVPS
jgi:hypothetical protein